jgi:hypothetical protein
MSTFSVTERRHLLDALDQLIGAQREKLQAVIDWINLASRYKDGIDTTEEKRVAKAIDNAQRTIRAAGHKLSRYHPNAECLPIGVWTAHMGTSNLGPREQTLNVSKEELAAWKRDRIRAITESVENIIAALEVQKATVTSAVVASEEEDGPTKPGKFFHAGSEYPFPPLQWRLLDALWGQGAVPLGNIAEKVYPGEDEGRTDGKLKKLKGDTGKKLLEYKLPFEIISPMSGFLELQTLSRK